MMCLMKYLNKVMAALTRLPFAVRSIPINQKTDAVYNRHYNHNEDN